MKQKLALFLSVMLLILLACTLLYQGLFFNSSMPSWQHAASLLRQSVGLSEKP